jgi:hypothetical protein
VAGSFPKRPGARQAFRPDSQSDEARGRWVNAKQIKFFLFLPALTSRLPPDSQSDKDRKGCERQQKTSSAVSAPQLPALSGKLLLMLVSWPRDFRDFF